MNIEKPLNPTTNEEIIEKWLGKDAPLLPVLHAFHDRDNYLSDESIKFVSDKLKIPIAELYATITFYHHFSRDPDGKKKPRVCTGNVCCLNGGNELLNELKDQGATPMPCAGRCDEMVPVIIEDDVFVGKHRNLWLTFKLPYPSLILENLKNVFLGTFGKKADTNLMAMKTLKDT